MKKHFADAKYYFAAAVIAAPVIYGAVLIAVSAKDAVAERSNKK